MKKRFFSETVLIACVMLSPGIPLAEVFGPGANVGGEANTTPGGIIATEEGVANAATFTVECINKGMEQSTKKILAALQGILEGIKTLDGAKIETLLEGLKQLEEAKYAAKEEAKARAQAANSCENRDGAAAWGVGKKAAEGFRTDLNARVTELEDGKPKNSQEAADINESRGLEGPMEDQSPNGEWIFPPNGLIADQDMAKAEVLAQLAVNPFPTPKVPDGLKGSVAGKDALYRQQVKKARLAVAHDTINDVIASHAPLVDAGAVLEALKNSMGHSKTSVPMNEQGRTSLMAFLDVWSDARFGNPNWFQELFDSTDEIKILKEIAFMRALSVEMQRSQLKFEMRNSHMLATIIGILAEKDNTAIHLNINTPRAAGR